MMLYSFLSEGLQKITAFVAGPTFLLALIRERYLIVISHKISSWSVVLTIVEFLVWMTFLFWFTKKIEREQKYGKGIFLVCWFIVGIWNVFQLTVLSLHG